jgi:SAM-dependent methyltransferase
MPDQHFADPRLAEIYDFVEGQRRDLDAYEAIAIEVEARSVLDVGCGTGVLACRLARRGLTVTGLDPAAASLTVARGKPEANRVTWICGSAADAPLLGADLATMTGNVAQVFVSDEEWSTSLAAVWAALRPGGWLVFEARDPARREWLTWNPDETRETVQLPDGSAVEVWVEVTDVAGPLVSFTSWFRFGPDDVLTSTSTLRFRERDEVVSSVEAAGLTLVEVRDAPDRPGLEFVYVARRQQ